MNRKNKLYLNTGFAIINQVVTLICGFILPKLYISYFGSSVNGLVSSITQFLGFIALGELGVGAVVQSSLYKPLAYKDNLKLSKIIISSEKFFRKLSFILAIYIIGLCIFYPLLVNKNFSYEFTVILILAISISSFAQYFLGMTYQLLLNADQRSYVPLGVNALSLILNTIVCVILIKLEFSIQFIKLISSLIFLLRPLFLMLYVKRNYNLNKKIVITKEPIKQKWNGVAQHISTVVLNNTDIMVLTLFSSLDNVSVYAIYNLVVTGVKQAFLTLTTGISSLIGNMLAKDEIELLNKTFSKLEWLIHTGCALLFGITLVLIVPFVEVYTVGINDVNYIVPVFGCLITLAQAVYCIRIPYNIVVLAAGHYKQTQVSAIIEMCINIIVSCVLVIRFGLVGVAIGTLLAMSYRTIYFSWYLSKNILFRSIKYFYKHVFVDIISILLIFVLTSSIRMTQITYIAWVIYATKVAFVALIIVLAINILLYRKIIISFVKDILNKPY